MAVTGYEISGYKNINLNNEDGTAVVTISDSDGVLTFSREDNLVYISYGENSWINLKDNSNLHKTEVEIYYDKNLTPKTRDTYINFINKQTGYINTFFITQDACNYDIVVGRNSYGFIDKDTPLEIDFSVYGNTRKCRITNEHFSIIKENEKYYPFDRGLGFQLTKMSDDEVKNCTNYRLSVEYIGNISNLSENDKYGLVIQHSDNRKTKQLIEIDVSVIINSENIGKEDKLLAKITNLPSAISDYENENKRKRETLYTIPTPTSARADILSMNKIPEIPKLPPLVVEKIENDIIYIQSNTYNRSGDLEHNSMVFGTKMAQWCSIGDIYDDEKGIHEITVKCKPNKFGILRKSYLVLTNAERINGQKKFLISQDKDNKIMISEVN